MKKTYYYEDEAVHRVEQMMVDQLGIHTIAQKAVSAVVGYDSVPVSRDLLEMLAPLFAQLIDSGGPKLPVSLGRPTWSEEIESALSWLIDQSFNPAVAEAFAATNQ